MGRFYGIDASARRHYVVIEAQRASILEPHDHLHTFIVAAAPRAWPARR
jgi:hypothetical protein